MKINGQTIGVFFGSRSPEHDVSIITGTFVVQGLKAIGYNVVPVYISKEGAWYTSDTLGSLDFYTDPTYPDKLQSFPSYSLVLNGSQEKMILEKKTLLGTSQIIIDCAFPCFHGSYGEDGTIQGLFEMCQVPYVGCGVTASALAMDKVLTKEMYNQHSIPTTDFVYFTQKEWIEYQKDIEKQIKDIGYPVFVKPPRAGSSIGITKATNEKELVNAIQVAFKFDNKCLVEKGVSPVVDLTVSVIGNYLNPDTLQVSEIQESRFSDEFFTYDEKYLEDGGAQLDNKSKNVIIPADIDQKITEKIKTIAKHAYVVFGCEGMARVDFLYNKEKGIVYANEINTIPGTLYHHLWRESGMSFADLLRTLISLSFESHRSRKTLTYSFSSSILKYVTSSKLSKKI